MQTAVSVITRLLSVLINTYTVGRQWDYRKEIGYVVLYFLLTSLFAVLYLSSLFVLVYLYVGVV